MIFRSQATAPVLASIAAIIVLVSVHSARAQVPSGTADPNKGAQSDAPEKAGATNGQAAAGPSRPDPVSRASVDRASVGRLLFRANPMLWPLAVCSIVTLGYILERALALRRERVIPHEFTDRFLERLSTGKLDRERALELCRAHDSPAARIFALVVNSWGQSGVAIRQTLSYDAAGEVVELKRNLRILSAISTLGPLLGLLGTVVGIIQSFDALGGRVGPARGEALAQGISLALVATAFGLAIAIVAVASYYFFLNRVDILVRELDSRTRQVIELVSAESQRLSSIDRRQVSGTTTDPHRQESRVL